MKKFILFVGILFFSISTHAQLIVNNNPYPLIECDDDGDGFAFFNLHLADADIAMGNTSYYFTYHKTVMDAENGTNALVSPYMNEVIYIEVVFARAEDTQGNYAVVELELQVVDNLPITQPIDLVVPDSDGDGIAIFDLTVNDAIVLEGLNPELYSVTYYETQANAVLGEFAIFNPTIYNNIQNPQTIYVRVESLSGNCVVVASFNISTETLSTDYIKFENLSTFPNPTSGTVTIQSSELVSETTIALYDIVGKRLFSKKSLPQNSMITLDISFIENGVYFLKISSEGKEAVQRLIRK